MNDIDGSQIFFSEPKSISDHLIVYEILFFSGGGGGISLGIFFFFFFGGGGGGSSSLFTRIDI